MKYIPLSQGKQAIVDDDDFERVNQFKWYVSLGYGRRNNRVGGKKTSLQLHRFILNLTDPKQEVDHLNGDGLDNRRMNLRITTHQENSKNNALYRNNTSGVAGVYWSKPDKKWKAKIRSGGKHLHLGYFDSLSEATKARKEAEVKYGFINRSFVKNFQEMFKEAA